MWCVYRGWGGGSVNGVWCVYRGIEGGEGAWTVCGV